MSGIKLAKIDENWVSWLVVRRSEWPLNAVESQMRRTLRREPCLKKSFGCSAVTVEKPEVCLLYEETEKLGNPIGKAFFSFVELSQLLT